MSDWGDGPADASNPAYVAWVAAGRPQRNTLPGPYRRTADRGATTGADPLLGVGGTNGFDTNTPHHRMPTGPRWAESDAANDNAPPDEPGYGMGFGPLAPTHSPGTASPQEDPEIRAKREADDRARRDAYARLQTVLDEYGLGSLGSTVQSWLVEGLSEAEIVQRMRETPEFKTRFPGIEERKRKGLAPISPGEYVAYERQARQMMRAAGLPEGFYDGNDDFTKFLSNDLSLSELGDRVTLAANAAFKMPREDREALASWGMGPGDLTAFWLDPDKAQPLLERKYAAAQLAGAGTRSGWGTLDEGRATDLATLGVTAPQAEQGFGQLAANREVFQSLDRTEDQISADDQIGAVFGGNAAAQRRIEQRKRKRQATFEAGGSFASGQSGISGLGDSTL